MNQRPDEQAEHIYRVEYTVMERLAGLFVLVALALLVATFAYSRQLEFLFTDTITLHAYIENADGVSENSAVKIAGLEVGKVTTLEWTPENRIHLEMEVRKRFHDQIREDSMATISGFSLLGNTAISISRGDPQKPRLRDGARIPVGGSPSLNEMLTSIAPAINDITQAAKRVNAIAGAIQPETLRSTVNDISGASSNIAAVARTAREGEGLVPRLLNDKKLAQDVQRNLDSLHQALQMTQQRLAELRPLMNNLNAATQDLPELISESSALANELTGTAESINNGASDSLSDILVRTRSVLFEAEQTLEAIQNTWPVSTGAREQPSTDALPPQPPQQ